MRLIPRFAWLAPLVLLLALVTALFVGPLLAPLLSRPAVSTATSPAVARPAVAPGRSAYRTLLTVSAFSYLLLGVLGLAVYRRSQQPRHWHPHVGPLSPVQVLPSGELS